MTLHNICCKNRDAAEISPNLFLTIILIKNIHLRVAGQAFEVGVKKRLRRLRNRLTDWPWNKASIILSDLKATFLLAVLAITIEIHFDHHFITALTLEDFALPSKVINFWRICSITKLLKGTCICPVWEILLVIIVIVIVIVESGSKLRLGFFQKNIARHVYRLSGT